jgi:hypothetical protein
LRPEVDKNKPNHKSNHRTRKRDDDDDDDDDALSKLPEANPVYAMTSLSLERTCLLFVPAPSDGVADGKCGSSYTTRHFDLLFKG